MMKSILPLLLCLSLNASAAERPPNIVFILADDLGWADTTLYGHTEFYRTPHIARLAERGMTFTNAYSASPLCSPTRAAILTGLSPARTGFTAPHGHLPEKSSKRAPPRPPRPATKPPSPSPHPGSTPHTPPSPKTSRPPDTPPATSANGTSAMRPTRPSSTASTPTSPISTAPARPAASWPRGNTRISIPTPMSPTSTSRIAWPQKRSHG